MTTNSYQRSQSPTCPGWHAAPRLLLNGNFAKHKWSEIWNPVDNKSKSFHEPYEPIGLVALLFISVDLGQTPAYTAKPRMFGKCLRGVYACLVSYTHRFSLKLFSPTAARRDAMLSWVSELSFNLCYWLNSEHLPRLPYFYRWTLSSFNRLYCVLSRSGLHERLPFPLESTYNRNLQPFMFQLCASIPRRATFRPHNFIIRYTFRWILASFGSFNDFRFWFRRS